MRDLTNEKIDLVFLYFESVESADNDIIYHHLQKPATTVFFDKRNTLSFDFFLKRSGFESFNRSQSTKFYVKVFGPLVLVIKVDEDYVKEKYWIINTESNIKFIKQSGLDYYDSFQSFNTDYEHNNNLYPESIEIPFFENFLVTKGDNTCIKRVDIGFKYQPSKFMVASLYDPVQKTIQICYDDYNDSSESIYPDYIEFQSKKLVIAEMVNRKNNKKISLFDHHDTFNLNNITIDNFHLFWERLTCEEKSLLDMLFI